MSIALPALHSRHAVQRSVPTRDLVIAFALTGTLIIATVATATAGVMPRIGTAILDLGLLGLAGRRRQPLPAAAATVIVVITSVLIVPEAIKLPVVAAVALVAYTLARYESGLRLMAGFAVCIGGVGVARLLLSNAQARDVTIIQLEVVVVLLPAVLAALLRVRGRLPELLGSDGLVGADRSEDLRPTDRPADLGPRSGPIASWGEFLLANRDRLLCAVAAALVLLVPLFDGSETGTLGRDIVVVGLAVIGVGAVGLMGRWPLPALLITLVAAIFFSGVAPLTDTYDTVIGGVVVIGLPLIAGGLLRPTPGLIALGACGIAIIVMDQVARTDALPVVDAATTSSQALSSLALAVGAWSTGRVLRCGGLVAWTEVATPVRAVPAPAALPRLLPDARELVQRAELLGLQPTMITVDQLPPQLHQDELSHHLGVVVREVLDVALDNAAQHAPGSELAIRVLHEPTAIRIEVINGRPLGEPGASGSGRGIPELADRIAAVGGMFGVGPASGGFALRARLPIKQLDDLEPVHDHRIGLEPSPRKVPAGVDTV